MSDSLEIWWAPDSAELFRGASIKNWTRCLTPTDHKTFKSVMDVKDCITESILKNGAALADLYGTSDRSTLRGVLGWQLDLPKTRKCYGWSADMDATALSELWDDNSSSLKELIMGIKELCVSEEPEDGYRLYTRVCAPKWTPPVESTKKTSSFTPIQNKIAAVHYFPNSNVSINTNSSTYTDKSHCSSTSSCSLSSKTKSAFSADENQEFVFGQQGQDPEPVSRSSISQITAGDAAHVLQWQNNTDVVVARMSKLKNCLAKKCFDGDGPFRDMLLPTPPEFKLWDWLRLELWEGIKLPLLETQTITSGMYVTRYKSNRPMQSRVWMAAQDLWMKDAVPLENGKQEAVNWNTALTLYPELKLQRRMDLFLLLIRSLCSPDDVEGPCLESYHIMERFFIDTYNSKKRASQKRQSRKELPSLKSKTSQKSKEPLVKPFAHQSKSEALKALNALRKGSSSILQQPNAKDASVEVEKEDSESANEEDPDHEYSDQDEQERRRKGKKKSERKEKSEKKDKVVPVTGNTFSNPPPSSKEEAADTQTRADASVKKRKRASKEVLLSQHVQKDDDIKDLEARENADSKKASKTAKKDAGQEGDTHVSKQGKKTSTPSSAQSGPERPVRHRKQSLKAKANK